MITLKETQKHAHAYIIERFDTCFLIDPSHDLEMILEYTAHKRIAGILLTHAHADHVDLIQHFQVPIYMSKEDAHLLFADEYNGYYPDKHPYKRQDLTFVFVADRDKIPFADTYIEVLETPGHTKGSLSFLYQDKVFVGDLLFKEDVGRHDLYSGHLPDLKKSVLMVIEMRPDLKVYPGHGESTTIRNERKMNPYVVKWMKQKK